MELAFLPSSICLQLGWDENKVSEANCSYLHRFLLTEGRERVGGNITSLSSPDGYRWEEGPNSFQPNDAMLKAAVSPPSFASPSHNSSLNSDHLLSHDSFRKVQIVTKVHCVCARVIIRAHSNNPCLDSILHAWLFITYKIACICFSSSAVSSVSHVRSWVLRWMLVWTRSWFLETLKPLALFGGRRSWGRPHLVQMPWPLICWLSAGKSEQGWEPWALKKRHQVGCSGLVPHYVKLNEALSSVRGGRESLLLGLHWSHLGRPATCNLKPNSQYKLDLRARYQRLHDTVKRLFTSSINRNTARQLVSSLAMGITLTNITR